MSNKSNPEILALPVDLLRTSTLSHTNREDVYSFTINAPTNVLIGAGRGFFHNTGTGSGRKSTAIEIGRDNNGDGSFDTRTEVFNDLTKTIPNTRAGDSPYYRSLLLNPGTYFVRLGANLIVRYNLARFDLDYTVRIVAGDKGGDTPSPAPSNVIKNETSSVYRFYNYQKGTHFFTNDTSERDTLQSNGYSMGYRYEGVAYQALSEGGTQLYRFYNASKGYHFLTNSEAEANNVISNSIGENYDVLTGQRIEPTKGGWGYQYEGRAFRVSTEQSDNTPTEIYRFYHQENGVHFYSASLDEVRNVITMSSGTEYANDLDAAMNAPLKDGGWGYQFEGTAWFV